jgi:hypothetical protein
MLYTGYNQKGLQCLQSMAGCCSDRNEDASRFGGLQSDFAVLTLQSDFAVLTFLSSMSPTFSWAVKMPIDGRFAISCGPIRVFEGRKCKLNLSRLPARRLSLA